MAPCPSPIQLPLRDYSDREKGVNRARRRECGAPMAAPPASLGRFDAKLLGEHRNLRALLIGRGAEFYRAADIEDLSGRSQPLANDRIGGHRLDIGGEALATL